MSLLKVTSEGIFVDDELKIPANSDFYLQKIQENLHFKTINGQEIIGEGNIVLKTNLLQTIVLKTPDKRYYFNSRNEVKLPGLSVNFQPKSDNSTIIVFATLAVTKPYVCSFALKYGDDWIDPPSSNNPNHSNSFITHYMGGNTHGYLQTFSINWAFNNNSMESKELALYFKNQWGNGYSFYLNDRNNNDMRSRSIMIIMEVQN